MPKQPNQKLKLYYLGRIMVEKTDDAHGLTMPEILKHLSDYGITADRKSIYDDMEALRILGIDVIGEKAGRSYVYHVGEKQFELAELKLLVDAIQSSKFITQKKSNALIKKLTSLVSEYEAAKLKRQVVVQGRIKTMNESIYYTVDEIHNAIECNKKIHFDYLRWNLDKELESRRPGGYEVSPWTLVWADENYYLVAYDSEAEKIKHYRVDKMKDIRQMDEKREGKEAYASGDMALYTQRNFGMFGGKEETVRLRFSNELVGVMLDRFGREIMIVSSDVQGHSETNVKVAVSSQFFGWIFALGTQAEIISPQSVVRQFADEVEKLAKHYPHHLDKP